MSKIVLTGGGTAGHIMPHIALMEEYKKYFNEIYYFGQKNGMEKQIIDKYKFIKFIEIDAVKFERKFTLKNLLIPFKLISSIIKTRKKLKEIKPDIIFSKGGFVSVPVVIAGKKLGIKIISHESDYSMGLANKIIYHYCTVMCTSFSDTCKKRKKCVLTGIPIRKDLSSGNKNNLLKILEFNNALKTILFLGGSLGAQRINQVIFSSLNELTKAYNVLHIVGKGNFRKNINSKNYHQTEFAENIADYFALADVVVCRSGAGTIFELLHLKKTMLLIPLPKEESRGDQIENAKYFKSKGYAEILEQKDLNILNLKNKIENMLKKTEKYKITMQNSREQNANKKIIDIILKMSNIKISQH